MNGSSVFDAGFLKGREFSHACIVTGASEEARLEAARTIAAGKVCTAAGAQRPCGVCSSCKKAAASIHPDVTVIQGEDGKPINVAQVRALRADAYVRPNEAERKVYLLCRADEMNDSAQNAMLKLLEEGPAYAAFLLVAEHDLRLLETVRSRCELVRLEGEETAGPDEAVVEKAAALAEAYLNGKESEFLAQLIPCEKWERSAVTALCGQLVSRFRDALVQNPAGAETRKLLHGVKTAEKIAEACAYNAAPGHLCGWLCGALFEETLRQTGASPF
ncbi:MAG: DNA polymerase III subunit delta [Oscillospiraceae bacterium]|nr:DNA polymerase III subunit delta [Oscillospiraceae bacterium]